MVKCNKIFLLLNQFSTNPMCLYLYENISTFPQCIHIVLKLKCKYQGIKLSTLITCQQKPLLTAIFWLNILISSIHLQKSIISLFKQLQKCSQILVFEPVTVFVMLDFQKDDCYGSVWCGYYRMISSCFSADRCPHRKSIDCLLCLQFQGYHNKVALTISKRYCPSHQKGRLIAQVHVEV